MLSQNVKEKYESEYANLVQWKLDKLRNYRFQLIADFIHKTFGTKPIKVLDYGGGDWYLSTYFWDNVEYHYIDLTDNQYKETKWKVYFHTFNADYSLPEFNTRFDVIILSEVIEHLPNVYDVLEALKNHVNKNWIIVCTTPNTYYRWYILRWIFWKYIDPSEQHVQLYDYSTLINIFKLAWYKPLYTDIYIFSYVLYNHCKIIDTILSKIFKNISLDLFQVYKL